MNKEEIEIIEKEINSLNRASQCALLSGIERKDWNILSNAMEKMLKENKQLKEQLDKYENPEDMTLYTMWCTEKVKDENKELKEVIETLKETNKLLLQQKGQLQEDLDMLDKRIDKALEFLENEYNTYSSANEWRKALKEILKGDNNE